MPRFWCGDTAQGSATSGTFLIVRLPRALTRASARGSQRRPAPQRSAGEVELERELGAVLQRVQLHEATRLAIAAGPASDRQRAVPGVEEWTLDRDLAAGEARCPVALVGLSGHDADAVTLIRAHHVSVGAVEDLVGEREDVAGGVARGARVSRGIGGGVLDHGERPSGPLAAVSASRPRSDRACQRHDESQRHNLHGDPSHQIPPRSGTGLSYQFKGAGWIFYQPPAALVPGADGVGGAAGG